MSGYELLTQIRSRWTGLPVIMITAHATPKLAVEAIKAGAIDYLPKPFAPEELIHAVERCVERHRLIQENAQLRSQGADRIELDQIVGECPAMVELRRMIETVAPTDARVLVLGESGTGKELVAGALHYLSQRTSSRYVRINCAAIPETLLESELFGHEKGAFTGAVKQKRGRVEEASGGTIFLDEIADMSGPLQAKLLRFLEDGSFTRVGGVDELKVDVRLIAATNRDLAEAISQDRFREDLFHRLNVVQLRLPPLRERGPDVQLLAEHFLRQMSSGINRKVKSISREAAEELLLHTWPGNVRELRNVMERALILERGESITPESLPDFSIASGFSEGEAGRLRGGDSLAEMVAGFERDLIEKTLQQFKFNVSRAAEKLGLSRHALRYRMQRLDIGPDSESGPNDPSSERIHPA
jgi:DNA-binding NtrC family response regulator